MAAMSTMTNGRPAPPASTSTTRAWSVHDASELYEVARWGNGYFSVNGTGHVEVHPTKDPQRGIDLKELVDRLHELVDRARKDAGVRAGSKEQLALPDAVRREPAVLPLALIAAAAVVLLVSFFL